MGRVLAFVSAGTGAASVALCPLSSLAASQPAWNVVEASDGGTCGVSTDGSLLIATPDGERYGLIVANVTLGNNLEREIRVDGTPVQFKWAQLRTTAFTPLDAAGLAKLAGAKTLELPWPDRTISLSTEGLPAALTKLKACGEAIKARRVVSSSPAAPGPSVDPAGPLVLSLECDGQGVWTAGGSVSSGIPGDVTHDHDVTYPSGGAGRVRVHFGADGNTVTFPATFPSSVSGRALKLSAVEVSADRIVGKMRGLLGQGTVLTVDRRSGDVNVNLGGVRFSGLCRKVDDAPAARKF
jgi:hypothetical protein